MHEWCSYIAWAHNLRMKLSRYCVAALAYKSRYSSCMDGLCSMTKPSTVCCLLRLVPQWSRTIFLISSNHEPHECNAHSTSFLDFPQLLSQIRTRTLCNLKPRYKATWVQGYLGTRLPGYKAAWVQGYLGTYWRRTGFVTWCTKKEKAHLMLCK